MPHRASLSAGKLLLYLSELKALWNLKMSAKKVLGASANSLAEQEPERNQIF